MVPNFLVLFHVEQLELIRNLGERRVLEYNKRAFQSFPFDASLGHARPDPDPSWHRVGRFPSFSPLFALRRGTEGVWHYGLPEDGLAVGP